MRNSIERASRRKEERTFVGIAEKERGPGCTPFGRKKLSHNKKRGCNCDRKKTSLERR